MKKTYTEDLIKNATNRTTSINLHMHSATYIPSAPLHMTTTYTLIKDIETKT